MLEFKFLLSVLCLVVCGSCGVQAVFILPEERTTGLGCIPDGAIVNYECTTLDTSSNPVLGSTVWQGSAFNCPTNNDISLSHGLYGSGESGTCGDLSAVSTGVDGTSYTSRLTVTANTGLDGTMINCTISNALTVGSDTIRVGVIPSAPGPVVITFSNSSPSSFTVSWSPPSSPVVGGIGGYMFGVTGDCGDCLDMTVSADTPSMACSGWTANDQTCTFEMRTLTQDCGFTSDPATSSVTLSVPSSPSGVSVRPQYTVDGSIQYVDVGFTEVVAPMLGAGLNSDITYNVIFDGSSSLVQSMRVTCNTTNYCTLRVQGSELSPSNTYTVSVVASNIVGSGTTPVFPTGVPSNIITGNIARVVVDVSAATVSCNLLSSYTDTPNAVCTISYGPTTTDRDMYMDSSTPTTGSSGDILNITLSQTLNPLTEYCYTVTLPIDQLVLDVVGTFRSTCDPAMLGQNPSSLDGPGMVTIMNGVVNYDGVTPDSTAQLVCADGHTGGVSNDRVCMSDGNWSGETQTCVQMPTSLSYGASIAISVIITFILTLVLGIIIGVVSVLLYNKCRRGTGQSSSQPPTELKQVGPIYEEPEDFKPDPNTEGNVAYGHVQPLHRRQ